VKSDLKSRDPGTRVGACLFLCLAMIFLSCSLHPLAFSSDGKWPGVDESVIEKYATVHGREPRQPLIPTDQGDLLLFAFFLAGVVGGFVAGYCWRTLMIGRGPEMNREKQQKTN
jgi:hypothetical protein